MEEIWRGGVPDDDLVLVRYETDEPLEYMVELFYGGGTSGPRVATTAAARGLAAALLRWADMVDGVDGTGGVRDVLQEGRRLLLAHLALAPDEPEHAPINAHIARVDSLLHDLGEA